MRESPMHSRLGKFGCRLCQPAGVEMEVVGENGRRLVLAGRTGAEDDTRYSATLVGEFGEVSTAVWEYQSSLAQFVRGLADDWQGFDGHRRYESTEGQLALRCLHDGVGVVECEITLCQPSPPAWSTSAVLTIGAGAHLTRVADDMEAFFAARG